MLSADAPQPVPPHAYPTQSTAAAMLGVAESTLSRAIRRHGIAVQRVGDRDRRVAAGDVLRLNGVFRRTIAEELAGALVAYAEAHEPSAADAVLAEVRSGLDELPVAARIDRGELLEELRHILPANWYREVERVSRSMTAGPVAIVAVTGDGGAADVQGGEGPSAAVSVAG